MPLGELQPCQLMPGNKLCRTTPVRDPVSGAEEGHTRVPGDGHVLRLVHLALLARVQGSGEPSCREGLANAAFAADKVGLGIGQTWRGGYKT